MYLLKSSNGKNLWLGVLASIMLFSIGVISHNAFADSVTTTIPVSGAYGIGVNSDTNLIYVATNQGFSIQSIDGSTNTVTATIATVNNPIVTGDGCSTAYVAVNPITNLIYADNGGCLYNMGRSFVSDNISVINGTTNSIVSTVYFGGGAIPSLPLAVNDVTDKIYACTPLQGENVIVIDGKTNQVTSRISISGSEPNCNDIAINSQTNKIYVLDAFQDVIHVIDGTTDTATDNIALGASNIEGIGVNPDTNKIYVSSGNGSLTVIDGSTEKVLTTLQTNAHGFIAVNPTTNKIYVGAIGDNNVTVIDGNTDTIMNTVQVENSPFGIGINSNTDKIYVGNSGSSTVSVIDGSLSASAPSAPQNLIATAGNSQVSLSWSASSNNGGSTITGYNVYRGTTSGGEGTTPIATVSGSTLTFTDTGLTNGQTYYYTVTAVNSIGESPQSNEASVTPVGPPQPPTGLTATGKLLQIGLNWNAPTDNGGAPVTGYVIERSTDGGSTWSTIVSNTGNTGTMYMDKNVLPLTTYTYRVSAINDVGTSDPSNTASATTPSIGPIIPPSLP